MNSALPVKNFVHISADVECTPERIRQLRWSGGRLLEFCTSQQEWRTIEIHGDADQLSEKTGERSEEASE